MDLTTVLRVVFSLGVVLALLWFSHRVAGRRTRSVARSGGEKLAVLARQGLTQKSAAVLLEAGGRRYLLGVTESSVTVIDRPEGGATSSDDAHDRTTDDTDQHTEQHADQRTFDETFDGVVAALAAQDEAPVVQRAPVLAPVAPAERGQGGLQDQLHDRLQDRSLSGVVDSLLAPATWRRAARLVRGSLR